MFFLFKDKFNFNKAKIINKDTKHIHIIIVKEMIRIKDCIKNKFNDRTEIVYLRNFCNGI